MDRHIQRVHLAGMIEKKVSHIEWYELNTHDIEADCAHIIVRYRFCSCSIRLRFKRDNVGGVMLAISGLSRVVAPGVTRPTMSPVLDNSKSP